VPRWGIRVRLGAVLAMIMKDLVPTATSTRSFMIIGFGDPRALKRWMPDRDDAPLTPPTTKVTAFPHVGALFMIMKDL
jgi:hypothetical protein